MHPAYSVILFTTSSGAGYGLLALIGLSGATHGAASSIEFAITTLVVALGLISVGLLSSTFHLGHPERAWRAFSQWRSSWLSREGVLALATLVPVGLFGLGWVVFQDTTGFFAVMGLLSTVLALATVYCTAMIYASLATVPAWRARNRCANRQASAISTAAGSPILRSGRASRLYASSSCSAAQTPRRWR